MAPRWLNGPLLYFEETKRAGYNVRIVLKAKDCRAKF